MRVCDSKDLKETPTKICSLHDCQKVKKIHDLEHLTNLVDLGIIGTSIKYKGKFIK